MSQSDETPSLEEFRQYMNSSGRRRSTSTDEGDREDVLELVSSDPFEVADRLRNEISSH